MKRKLMAKKVAFWRKEAPKDVKSKKLTPEQEQAIVRLKTEGQKVAAIARATGLSRPTVYSVLGAP